MDNRTTKFVAFAIVQTVGGRGGDWGTLVFLVWSKKKTGSTSQQLALFFSPDYFGLNLKPKTGIRQQHPLQALMKRHQAKIYELPLGMMGANTEKHRRILICNALYTLPLNNKLWEESGRKTFFLFPYFHRDSLPPQEAHNSYIECPMDGSLPVPKHDVWKKDGICRGVRVFSICIRDFLYIICSS